MARNQTRRSISVSKSAYHRFYNFAARHGVAVSKLTELAIEELMKRGPIELGAIKEETPRRYRFRPHHKECANPKDNLHSVCPL